MNNIVLVHYNPDETTLEDVLRLYDAENRKPHIVAGVEKLKERHPITWEEEVERLHRDYPFDGKVGFDEHGNLWNYSRHIYMHESWKVGSRLKCMWDYFGDKSNSLKCEDVGGIDYDKIIGIIVRGDEFWIPDTSLLSRVEMLQSLRPNDRLVVTEWKLYHAGA